MARCVFILAMVMMISSMAKAELIILASPPSDDSYYDPVEEEIFTFHIEFARQIMKHDRVLIFTDENRADRYRRALGKDQVVIWPMGDIWMRDFSLSNAIDPLFFRYTAEAQESQSDADDIQEILAQGLVEAGLSFQETDLLNDGGNFVDDYAGHVVISTKFLSDNQLSEDQARRLLTRQPSINQVAFIDSDEEGGLEHADGMVSFIDPLTLIVNSYPDDPAFAQKLKADLKRGLPDVTLHEIVTPYDPHSYDARFSSACGLYTNALVTPDRIYLPQFGVPEDGDALALVQSLTTKEVIAVPSANVCFMGGGVRCLSWQLRGENAQKLLNYLGL